ncbi:alkaline phosphatase D family protein [Pseudomonas sp.]|uniref:alkaline phosphatase D family protein n=1 Tax=Pseudomonas sp. TaxID=306 RepID=UPI001B0AA0DC|nr:alkaline phosphatase D family protein [Pseudomonas sp.]MBO9548073.1 alkaline phosphatase family protein [Pseudomonas sp.]
MQTLLGPVLQFRGISNAVYNVSALIVLDKADADPVATVVSGAKAGSVTAIADIPLLAPRYRVWRAEFEIKQKLGKEITVEITFGGARAIFVVPPEGQPPRMAYASCNGFSDPKLMEKVDKNNERWDDMASAHKVNPYHVLLMGGDQVYSDEMRGRAPLMKEWFRLSFKERADQVYTQAIEAELDEFYSWLYLDRWKQPEPKLMFASIPTIMMWDDHDIIDGWGSYPENLHASPVFQGLFATAKRYFRIFQQQLSQNSPHLAPSVEQHPCAIPGVADGFHLGFSNLGGLAIMVPDLRSERHPDLTTPTVKNTQIVSQKSWDAIYNWLAGVKQHKHMLVMSSIPVGYLDLQAAEKALDLIPGQQELEDDLRDHWRSRPHRDERLRLIMRLLDYASAPDGCKVTLVSGDVHVAGACVIESRLAAHRTDGAGMIYQLISTGIVHPSPPALAVYFLEALGASEEKIDYRLTGSMLPIGSRGRYLIPARNWLAIEPDSEAGKYRLWANWHVEGYDHLVTQVIDPRNDQSP